VVTTLDGFRWPNKAAPVRRSRFAAIGSFFAGWRRNRADRGARRALTKLALAFGPAEYFSLMVLG